MSRRRGRWFTAYKYEKDLRPPAVYWAWGVACGIPLGCGLLAFGLALLGR